MIFNINLRKLPSQYGEISVMWALRTETQVFEQGSKYAYWLKVCSLNLSLYHSKINVYLNISQKVCLYLRDIINLT